MNLNSLNKSINHVSGSSIKLTDFCCRNPVVCPDNSCQVCQFVEEQLELAITSLRDHTLMKVGQTQEIAPPPPCRTLSLETYPPPTLWDVEIVGTPPPPPPEPSCFSPQPPPPLPAHSHLYTSDHIQKYGNSLHN